MRKIQKRIFCVFTFLFKKSRYTYVHKWVEHIKANSKDFSRPYIVVKMPPILRYTDIFILHNANL